MQVSADRSWNPTDRTARAHLGGKAPIVRICEPASSIASQAAGRTQSVLAGWGDVADSDSERLTELSLVAGS